LFVIYNKYITFGVIIESLADMKKTFKKFFEDLFTFGEARISDKELKEASDEISKFNWEDGIRITEEESKNFAEVCKKLFRDNRKQ